MTETINGRTPEEIKKGLECCQGMPCKCWECPYDLNDGADCSGTPNEDALAYIQQLERERDEAWKIVDGLNAQIEGMVDVLESAKRKYDKVCNERDAAVDRCVNADDVSAGYYHEIQQLESAQPKWISVEERLPEESETVLVYRDGCYGVARLLDVEPAIMWTYTGFGGDPTHWRPLPEPPKEEV
jgi:hypothetical protein